MAKVLNEKQEEVDLNNLTKEDFLQMAHYIQHLEEQLEGCKAAGITLMTQRNNLQKAFNQMKYQNDRGIVEKPLNKVLDVDFDLVNPEQYREKKQF